MGRARRATRIAATAAYGGGGLAAGLGVLGLAGYGLLKVEARMARRIVGRPFERRPRRRRRVRRRAAASRSSWSSSATPGGRAWAPTAAWQTVGAIIANGVSAAQRPAGRLTNVAVIGAESSGLDVQVATPWPRCATPDVARDHGRRQRRDPPDRQVGRRAPPGPGGARPARRRRRGGRRHLPRPRHDRAGGPAAAAAGPAVEPRPGRGADGRRRRGGRPDRLARRPARPGVLRAPARDVQQRPVPPLARRLRAGRGGAAAQRLRRARPVGRRGRDRAGPPPRRGRRARSPTPPSQAVRDPGTEVSADRRSAGQPRGPRGPLGHPAPAAARAGHRPRRRWPAEPERGPARARAAGPRPGAGGLDRRPRVPGRRRRRRAWPTRRGPHHRQDAARNSIAGDSAT